MKVANGIPVKGTNGVPKDDKSVTTQSEPRKIRRVKKGSK